MGMNAIFGSFIRSPIRDIQFSYSNLLLAVFFEGLIFIFLSIIHLRKDPDSDFISLQEKIYQSIPKSLRIAIPVGIGLYMAFGGLKNANIIVTNPGTSITLVDFTNFKLGNEACQAIICIFDFSVITILSLYHAQEAVLIGIIAATIITIPLKVANLDIIQGKTEVSWKFWLNFAKFFSLKSNEGSFLLVVAEGVKLPSNSIFSFIILIITFMMNDMFATVGTIVGCIINADLLDERGIPKKFTRMMLCDSIATFTGAILGTSNVTPYLESLAGIAVGGKTGLTALTIVFFFLLSIFLMPIFAFIPSAAASSALVYVGVLMMGPVRKINFEKPLEAVPAFLTIIGIPFTRKERRRPL
jgi:AGZA family xanthine/uracil permease-like MFS transporter